MPLALILTPDDQAVSAITSVLEEMGVTWERPRDGASAATRLHSGNVDLVLVDCENLPAAKLILDVCRRTRTGRTLVGIAIADGRTGLPTAFRLGAEFILTRPVAKDQARNTIRAALNRSKKAGSASGAATENSSDQESQANHDLVNSNHDLVNPNHDLVNSSLAPQDSTLANHVQTEDSGDGTADPKTMTVAASGESSWREIRYIASSESASMSAAAHDVSEVVVGRGTGEPGVAAAIEAMDSGRDSLAQDRHSDDLVLAEIDRTERENKASVADSGALVDAEEEGHEKKGSGLIVALLVLALLCSGFYAAWITQPRLRTFLGPQIERVETLIGIGNTVQPSARSLTHPHEVQRNPALASFKPADNTVSTGQMAAGANAIPAGSETLTTSKVAPSPTPNGSAQLPGISTPDAKANLGGAEAGIPAAGSQDINIVTPNADSQSSKPKQKGAANTATASGQSETAGVVLSSKGAEKRLVSSVPPQYQQSTRSEGAVVLKVSIDADGKVASAQVVGSQSDFANAAVAAVRQWRYRPYIRNGEAVPFETIVQINPAQP